MVSPLDLSQKIEFEISLRNLTRSTAATKDLKQIESQDASVPNTKERTVDERISKKNF